jgi:TPR repeat protein
MVFGSHSAIELSVAVFFYKVRDNGLKETRFTTFANVITTWPSLTLRQNMIYLKISVYFSVKLMRIALNMRFDLGNCINLDSTVINLALGGQSDALYNVGMAYYAKSEYTKALKWFQLASKKSNAEAQFRLGYMFDRGEGVRINYQTAMDWYIKAYNNGDIAATNNIGYLYEQGSGVERNDTTALKWYIIAARKGSRTAQYNVGEFYQEGRGVDKNDTKALEWYKKSADQGDQDAQAKVDELSREVRAISTVLHDRQKNTKKIDIEEEEDEMVVAVNDEELEDGDDKEKGRRKTAEKKELIYIVYT